MAATLEAQRLTEAHRLLQSRVAAQTVDHTLTLWPLLNVNDLDATSPRWTRAMIQYLQAQRVKSAGITANYLHQFRVIELGEPFPAVIAGPAPVADVATSLLVSGPISIKSNMRRGVNILRATDIAISNVGGEAMRIALDAGRETLVNTVAADPRAKGWARVTSGASCKFCEMLAGRGAVYSERTVRFETHRGCNCAGEPAYR